MSRVANLALGLALPVTLAVLWQVAASTNVIDPAQWASPTLVVQAFGTQFADPQFWTDLSASLVRAAEGTALGVVAGIPLGVGLGLSSTLRGLFAPVLDAAKAVPFFTWVPLLSVWVGSGEEGKVTFIALAAALPVLFSTIEGVFSIQPRHRELARLLKLRAATVLRRVILPGAAPGILRGVHLSLLYGWLGTIGAEYFFQAGPGIGGNIMGARELFALDIVVVDMIVIGLIGILLDNLARGAERYWLRGQGGHSA